MINKMNLVCENVLKYLEDNKDVFASMNLKVYDASYYSYKQAKEDYPLLTEGQISDTFWYFCEQEFDCFVDDLKELGINWHKIHKQIGSTSSFHLKPENTDRIVYFNNRVGHCNEIDKITTISELLYVLDYNNLEYTAEGISFDNYIEEDEKEDYANNFIDNFEKEIKDLLQDCITTYENIKSFKDNQIEIFKDYLEQENEYVKDCKEEEKKQLEKYKEDCILIYDSICWTLDTLSPSDFLNEDNSEEKYKERIEKLTVLKDRYFDLIK